MEAVVEKIEDEEQSPQWIRREGRRDYLIGARAESDALRFQLGVELPRGE